MIKLRRLKFNLTCIFAVVLTAGCTTPVRPSLFIADPLRTTRPINVDQEKLWSAITKTIIEEGDHISVSERSIGRIKFDRHLTEEQFKESCTVDKDSKHGNRRINHAFLEVGIVLDPKPDSSVDMIVEGRCYAVLLPPKANMIYSVAPFAFFGGLTAQANQLAPVILSSNGKFEEEFKQKVVTALGVEMPQWMKE